MDNNIKKNILDLEYNKYLQYFNTLIVLIFTYFIGLLIALFTKQLNYTNGKNMLFIFLILIIFMVTFIVLIVYIKEKMKNIIKEIKTLSYS